MLRFELDRYLGWPGQAPSYKLGERIWLQAREDAKARRARTSASKEFHSQALALGSHGPGPAARGAGPPVVTGVTSSRYLEPQVIPGGASALFPGGASAEVPRNHEIDQAGPCWPELLPRSR